MCALPSARESCQWGVRSQSGVGGVDSLRESNNCPACNHREFPWLDGARGSHTAVLCGRNAVQLSFADRQDLSLESLAVKLEGLGQVKYNRYLLRADIAPYQVTVFPDGRAIIGGTEDIAEAKTVYARYIGA